jgi:HPt (histidine-containing phosphotransfer) domain-containing protein
VEGPLDNDVHVLDPEALAALSELLGDDPAALAELVDAFVEEAPVRLAELRSDDVALAGRAAHTLKSNALAFGGVELAAVCRQLEAAARDGGLDGSRDLIDRADAEWARVNAELAGLGSR